MMFLFRQGLLVISVLIITLDDYIRQLIVSLGTVVLPLILRSLVLAIRLLLVILGPRLLENLSMIQSLEAQGVVLSLLIQHYHRQWPAATLSRAVLRHILNHFQLHTVYFLLLFIFHIPSAKVYSMDHHSSLRSPLMIFKPISSIILIVCI